MIRINRLVKKTSLYKILDLPHVAKIELVRRKTNQKDPNVIRVCIYLTSAHCANERGLFVGYLKVLRQRVNNEDAYAAISTAIHDGFIKESTYNKFEFPKDSIYSVLCNKYNQEFFDTL